MYRLLFTICVNSPALNAKFCYCSMVVLSCKQNFLWMFVHSKAVKLWCQYCWVWKHNKWDGEWRYNCILQIAEENHGFSFPVWLCTKIIIKLCFFKSKRKLFHECDAKFRVLSPSLKREWLTLSALELFLIWCFELHLDMESSLPISLQMWYEHACLVEGQARLEKVHRKLVLCLLLVLSFGLTQSGGTRRVCKSKQLEWQLIPSAFAMRVSEERVLRSVFILAMDHWTRML